MGKYSPYDFITKLKIIGKSEPHWYHLRFKPIWKETYQFYTTRDSGLTHKYDIYRTDWDNGWGRYFKQLRINIYIPFIKLHLHFWMFFDVQVHENGPTDWNKKMRVNKKTMKFEWINNKGE